MADDSEGRFDGEWDCAGLCGDLRLVTSYPTIGFRLAGIRWGRSGIRPYRVGIKIGTGHFASYAVGGFPAEEVVGAVLHRSIFDFVHFAVDVEFAQFLDFFFGLL